MQLAGEILSYMNSTVASGGAKKLGVQFGAYATALSLFGLLDLPKTSSDFTGVIDYASSLVFELVTDAVIRTSTAKEVSAGHRLFGIVQGALLYAHDMAAMGQQLAPHLSARLLRVAG